MLLQRRSLHIVRPLVRVLDHGPRGNTVLDAYGQTIHALAVELELKHQAPIDRVVGVVEVRGYQPSPTIVLRPQSTTVHANGRQLAGAWIIEGSVDVPQDLVEVTVEAIGESRLGIVIVAEVAIRVL